jgi:hypothetical protein
MANIVTGTKAIQKLRRMFHSILEFDRDRSLICLVGGADRMWLYCRKLLTLVSHYGKQGRESVVLDGLR